MTLRTTLLSALLLAGLAASAQNNLFNTTTTGPAPKAAPGTKTGGPAQPIEVASSGRGTFDLKEEFAIYRENVRVNDPQFFLRCDTLRLSLDLKTNKSTNQPPASSPPSSVPPLTAAPFGSSVGRIRQVDADGHVVFSNKVDSSQAFASHMTYSATNDAFELTGNPRVLKINDKGTNAVVADRIWFYRAKGLFETAGESTTTFHPTRTNSPPANPDSATKKP